MKKKSARLPWSKIRFRYAVEKRLREMGKSWVETEDGPDRLMFSDVSALELFKGDQVGWGTIKEVEQWLGHRLSGWHPLDAGAAGGKWFEIPHRGAVLLQLFEMGVFGADEPDYKLEPSKAAFDGVSSGDLLKGSNVGKKTVKLVEAWLGRKLNGSRADREPAPDEKEAIGFLKSRGYTVYKKS